MSRRHTLGQRIIRTLFIFFGPAQSGPPPYATAEELEAYRSGMRALPPAERTTPPGFAVREVVDENGVARRYLVRPDESGSDVDPR